MKEENKLRESLKATTIDTVSKLLLVDDKIKKLLEKYKGLSGDFKSAKSKEDYGTGIIAYRNVLYEIDRAKEYAIELLSKLDTMLNICNENGLEYKGWFNDEELAIIDEVGLKHSREQLYDFSKKGMSLKTPLPVDITFTEALSKDKLKEVFESVSSQIE